MPSRLEIIEADITTLQVDAIVNAANTLLRRGGLIAVDNTLWNGNVADPDNNTEDTRAIRALNTHIHADDRVDICMLPIGDGLTLALKR